MNRVAELADRYVAAYRRNDEAEMVHLSYEIAPSEWNAVMAHVEVKLPELARPLDPDRLVTAGTRMGMDPSIAAAVTEGLTGDLASFLKPRLADEGLAEGICEAAPSLAARDAGRVRFRLRQLSDGLLDARRLPAEALSALATATGQSLEYVRTLTSTPMHLSPAGMAARAQEQHVGTGQPDREVEGYETVDAFFGIGSDQD